MNSTLIIVAASIVFSLVIVVFVLRQAGVFGPRRRVLSSGVAGTAQILGVTPTGTVINHINYVCRFQLRVQIPGRPGYDVETKEAVPITAMSVLAPGSTVSVRVDPNHPESVYLDLSGGIVPPGAMPPAASAVAAAVADPRVAATVSSGSASQLLSTGQPARGVLRSFADTGQTPRSMGRPADPGGADDPIFVLTVDLYFAPNSLPVEGMVMHRVPRALAPALTIGMEMACAADPGNPSRNFAVDWNSVNNGAALR